MEKLLKILLFALLIGITILMFGCVNTQKTTKVISTKKIDSLKFWEQSMRENIKISDNVFFYKDV